MSIVITTATSGPKSNDDREIAHLCELVQSRTGIQLGPQKHVMVRSRLTKRLRTLNLSSFREYIEYLKKDATHHEMTQMTDLLTTNKTSFYREPRHFEVFGELLDRVAGSGNAARVWSAGCSSGEEPYTMAATALQNRLALRILATDISTRVLAKAKAGTYARDTIADVPANVRTAHFPIVGNDVQIPAASRALVSFASLNLLGPWPMKGPFDAIFCRNVMIYFDKPTRETLVERFRQKLAPHGLFFIGLSESLTGLRHGYRLVEPGVYAP